MGYHERHIDLSSYEENIPVVRFGGHLHNITAVSTNRAENIVVSGDESWVCWVWNMASGQAWNTLTTEGDPVEGLAISPDGRHLAIGCASGLIHLCRLGTQTPPWIAPGHTSKVNAMAFSADGRHLATSGEDGVLRLWQLNMND